MIADKAHKKAAASQNAAASFLLIRYVSAQASGRSQSEMVLDPGHPHRQVFIR